MGTHYAGPISGGHSRRIRAGCAVSGVGMEGFVNRTRFLAVLIFPKALSLLEGKQQSATIAESQWCITLFDSRPTLLITRGVFLSRSSFIAFFDGNNAITRVGRCWPLDDGRRCLCRRILMQFISHC